MIEEYRTTEKQREYYRNRQRKSWRNRIIRFFYYAKKRFGDEVTITVEQLEEQLEKQNYLCYYSGLPLQLDVPKIIAPSFDRLDNCKGYEPGNVVICLWCINRAKNNLTETDFISMCKAVVIWQESEKKEIPQVNLQEYNHSLLGK